MAILLLLIFLDNKEKRKLLTYPRQSQKGELHLYGIMCFCPRRKLDKVGPSSKT